MTTEDIADDYPGGWFGESWGAPVCKANRQLETPVGESCMDCEGPIAMQDRGMIIPYVSEDEGHFAVYHLDCFLRSITGIRLDAESP